MRRVPSLAQAGVRRVVNGPEAFTPDNEFILGESEVPGFWVAAGFCAHGIAGAAGVGRQVASWIVDGEPELDVWRMDIRRFGAAYGRSATRSRGRRRSTRPTTTSTIRTRSARPGRPLRMSPAYDALVALGAVFGEKSGGSGRTGSNRTRTTRASVAGRCWRRCGLVAGPVVTGRRRSRPRRSRLERRPRSSTSRPSPSSRSTGPEPWRSSSASAGTMSTNGSDGSSTRSCSTAGVGSRPT